MEALSASRDLREPCKVQKSAAPLKTEAVFDPVTITAGAEEAGQSTAYCSSEEELSGAELYISEDERQDSDFVPQKTQQQQQQPAAYQQASGTQQHIPPQLAQQPTPTMAPYTYTVTSMDGMTMDQAPTSWLKPRIKIDGPEVFHGTFKKKSHCCCFAPNALNAHFMSQRDRQRQAAAARVAASGAPCLQTDMQPSAK